MSAEDWLPFAARDLDAASALLEIGRHPETIAFLAQQGAEKYIKAFLASRGVEPPKIHNLGVLVEQCRNLDPSFDAILSRATSLTEYAVTWRYPPAVQGPLPLAEARDALERAKTVAAFVLARLNTPPVTSG